MYSLDLETRASVLQGLAMLFLGFLHLQYFVVLVDLERDSSLKNLRRYLGSLGQVYYSIKK